LLVSAAACTNGDREGHRRAIEKRTAASLRSGQSPAPRLSQRTGGKWKKKAERFRILSGDRSCDDDDAWLAVVVEQAKREDWAALSDACA
jgi:hypothetical protein